MYRYRAEVKLPFHSVRVVVVEVVHRGELPSLFRGGASEVVDTESTTTELSSSKLITSDFSWPQDDMEDMEAS